MRELMNRFLEQMNLRDMFPVEMSAWWNKMEICSIEREVTEYLEAHPEIKYNGQVSHLIKQIAKEKGTLYLLEAVTERLM